MTENLLTERPVGGTIALLALAVHSLVRRSTKALALGGALALTVALAASVLFLTDALRGAAERVRAYWSVQEAAEALTWLRKRRGVA